MKIIFDLDDTLYVSPDLRNRRQEAILNFLGERQESFHELKRSFGTIESFIRLGISPVQFYELMKQVPINLERDEELIRIISRLKKDYYIIVLSNSPIFCVRQSLEKLGIWEFINETYTAESFEFPKPDEECFFMVEKGDICVGNSFRKDLMIPKQKGATTVFVGGQHPEADFSINTIHELEKFLPNQSSQTV